MAEKQVTRIDLEQAGPGQVIVKKFFEGWREGDACELIDFSVGKSIPALLTEYEKQGFTCEMVRANIGRALRGQITRIDFLQVEDGWTIKRWPYGWTAKTRPLVTEEKPADFDVEGALSWCEAHGWTVFRWPGGARAWKGEPLPVRDRSAIFAMRRQADEALRTGQGDGRSRYDFAFYF